MWFLCGAKYKLSRCKPLYTYLSATQNNHLSPNCCAYRSIPMPVPVNNPALLTHPNHNRFSLQQQLYQPADKGHQPVQLNIGNVPAGV